MQRPDTIATRTALYQEALAVLREEYATDITVAQLADHLGCSCRQLQRAFHEIGATSFRSALIGVRMEAAATVLTESEAPVREAARSVGYRQPAQFAKAFRRHHGVVPSQYRSTPQIGRRTDRRAERAPIGSGAVAA